MVDIVQHSVSKGYILALVDKFYIIVCFLLSLLKVSTKVKVKGSKISE